MKITSADICKLLRKTHAKDIWCEELRLSSGFGWAGRMDFWALSAAPSDGNKATAYEIKVTRSDFKRDSYDKQRGARLFSDTFHYVTPKDMVTPEEIPDWAGLIEVEWRRIGHNLFLQAITKIHAPKRDKEAPTWGLVCSIIRNENKFGGKL